MQRAASWLHCVGRGVAGVEFHHLRSATLKITLPTVLETEKTMKKQTGLALLVCCFIFNPAFAENAQQSKMATCNKDATGKAGGDRKAFMKDCLSKKSAAAASMSQQEKMKECNVDATGKKGDDRKAFMKQCLSKSKE
jgi:hypothetical protein